MVHVQCHDPTLSALHKPAVFHFVLQVLLAFFCAFLTACYLAAVRIFGGHFLGLHLHLLPQGTARSDSMRVSCSCVFLAANLASLRILLGRLMPTMVADVTLYDTSLSVSRCVVA